VCVFERVNISGYLICFGICVAWLLQVGMVRNARACQISWLLESSINPTEVSTGFGGG
jgi:hypothetical protein